MPWSNCLQTVASCWSVHGPPLRSVRLKQSARDGAHHQLADQRALQRPYQAGPLKSRQQRDRVDQHQALDAVGLALREGKPRGSAPVVHHEPHPLDPEVVEQGTHEIRVTVDRVVEVAALARAPEPDQVRGEPPGPLQERDEVIGARRDAVQDTAPGGR